MSKESEVQVRIVAPDTVPAGTIFAATAHDFKARVVLLAPVSSSSGQA